MKIIVAIAVGFFGLVPGVFAVSSAQDNGKMKLDDPLPAVTALDQDGKPVNLEGDDARVYRSGLQPPRFLRGVATKGSENFRSQR
jgi:hypothetical protein